MTSNDYEYVVSEKVSSGSEKSIRKSCCHRRTRFDCLGCYAKNTWERISVYGNKSSAINFIESDHYPAYEEIFSGSRNVLGSELTREEIINYANVPILGPKQPQKVQFREKSVYAVEEERPFNKSFSSCQQKISGEISDFNKCETCCSFRRSPRSKCDVKCWNNYRELLNSAVGPIAEQPFDTDTARMISDIEKHKIETFFRGLGTDLFVSSSLANLYAGWKNFDGKWSYKHTGIPLILLDRGHAKSRNKRRIQIMLAERGTCFPLWKDVIDNLTSYEKAGEAFHTMHLSSNHRQIIGLSFDSSEESNHFYNRISELVSDPENINIYIPTSKKNKKHLNKKLVPLLHKEQISNPCLFQHVTSIAAKDKSLYVSLKTLSGEEFIKKQENVS